MKRLLLLTLTASMLAMSGAGMAQTPVQPAPDAGAAPPDAAAPAKKPARAKANPGDALRRSTCRKGADQSLTGADLADAMQVCMLEARLTCLKQAVADKVQGKKRAAFMNTCAGS
jgi:hypothetical protein